MLVTLGTYRGYNTKIQLLLAAGPQFGLKIGGGGMAGLPWIGHCWSFYNFVDPLLRDPVMVTQDHRPEKNSKGR